MRLKKVDEVLRKRMRLRVVGKFAAKSCKAESCSLAYVSRIRQSRATIYSNSTVCEEHVE